MTTSIYDLTSPDVAKLIADNPVAVIPFGSTEQHGPHLPCGTDAMAGEIIGQALAERIGALYVPFGPYGVTPIHAGHPGSISLRRSTFEALLTDICEELIDMGVRRIVFVNWHEGNIASMDAVATDVQHRHDDVYVIAAHACYTAQRIYADEGGELTHGGGLEALAVMAYDGDLLHVDRAGDATRPEHAFAMDDMRRSKEIYGFITDVTEIDADGWYGDPTWASEDRAGDFADRVAAAVQERVEKILALRDGR
jgi:creatinine amidohydrolase